MTNEEARAFLQGRIDLIDKWYPQTEDYREALDLAIKALEQQSNIHDRCKKCVEFSEQVSRYLTDRPCSVCDYHTEDGCSKWDCVFEEVNADATEPKE